MERPEILSPAGSFEALVGAINSGADAIYVGGNKFGARAYANNFDKENLIEAINYVHLYNKKIYLTVNTLFKNDELEKELYDYLKDFYEVGLDACIVQDVGVAHFIRKNFPDMALHISTQMTITNIDSAMLMKKIGATRIVTARELSLAEIKKIKDTTNLEIESFVHGALCICYSGQCLLSSMIGGRSGNRGRCAQPCRLPYSFYDDNMKISNDNERYILSPKDLCAIELIPELVDAGIDSFKIEGRMKRPEYVATVTALYRKYLDLYLKNKSKKLVISDEDRQILLESYNRGGFTDGYYKIHNSKNMMSMKQPNHKGLLVGNIEKIVKNKIIFRAKTDIHKKDILEIKINSESKIELTSSVDVKSNELVELNGKNLKQLKVGMEIYRTKNEFELDKIRKEFIEIPKKIKLKAKLKAKLEKKLKLEIFYNNFNICVEGEIPIKSINQPISAEKIIKQLKKTGGTKYEFEDINIDISDDLFISLKSLNELRRNAIFLLEEKIKNSYKRKLDKDVIISNNLLYHKNDTLKKVVSLMDKSKFDLILNNNSIDIIYLDMADISFEEFDLYAKKSHLKNKKIYFILPAIFREDIRADFEKNIEYIKNGEQDGYVIRNIDEFAYFVEKNITKEYILEYNLYAYNKEARYFYNEYMDNIRFTLPIELNQNELEEFRNTNSELIVYGYLPVMFTANCFTKNLKGCNKIPSNKILKDRFNNSFYVKNNCRYCYNTIYNSKPLYLLDNKDKIDEMGLFGIRFHFTNESENEIKNILNNNLNLEEYTRGHFRRGIE